MELAADAVLVRAPVDPARAPDAATLPSASLEPDPCDAGATAALLSLKYGAGGASRRIDLADIDPMARPRALAIAMADMVRKTVRGAPVAAERAPASASAEPPRTSGVAPATDFARPPPRPARWVGVVGDAGTRLLGTTAALFGGHLGAHAALAPWLVAMADVGVLGASGHDPLGKVDTTVATVGASVLAVGGSGPGGALGVGPRLEVGAGGVRGHASDSTVLAASASEPLLFLSVSAAAWFPISRCIQGFASADAGETLVGFSPRADDRYIVDVSGAFASLRIGVSWTASGGTTR